MLKKKDKLTKRRAKTAVPPSFNELVILHLIM